jgi:hypothetical protein
LCTKHPEGVLNIFGTEDQNLTLYTVHLE